MHPINLKLGVFAVVLCAALPGVSSVHAAESIKVGFLTTLSGPGGALGTDMRDGFRLAVKHAGGKLGGLETEIIVVDDQQKADIGRQAADRLIKRDRIDVMTGMVFSSVLLPLMPSILNSDTVYISTNTGPAEYAGAKCNRNFFVVSFQNEDHAAAMGKYVTEQKHRSVFLIAPNYPGGQETLDGFKRQYEGTIADEVYVKLGQLDYAAELAQARASGADSIFFFLPGGMGISFIKQLEASGLSKNMTLYTPGFSADQDTISAVGDPMLGILNSSQWSPDFKSPQNQKFVADFENEYGRIPTLYASQGYDAAMLLHGAVQDVKGKIEDKNAFRQALRAANFNSVRGGFKFNTNQYPIQDFYLRKVVKDERGRITNETVTTILEDYQDPFVSECRMEQS